jgi:PAS domain S-box-containing protein
MPNQTGLMYPNKAIQRTAILSVIIGAVVLVGWFFDIKALRSVFPGFVSIKVNCALCHIFLGIALLIKNSTPGKIANGMYRALLILVGLIGLLNLLQYHFKFDAGIDQLLITDLASLGTPFPGRLAYNTALCFALMGFGLLGLSTKPGKHHVVCQYLLHVVTVITSIALIGYIYGVSLLYNVVYVSSMALPNAVLLFLLSITATLLNPHLGITQLFTGRGVGNLMARRHFVTLTLTVIVFGSLRIQTQRFHIFSPEVGISLLAVSLILTSLVMIWMTANWLNKVDYQRSVAEEEVKNMNADLEKKVEERSAQLRELYTELEKSEEKYRSLYEQASDAIYVLNYEGNFISVNESMVKTTDYSRDELLQMNITALLNAEILQHYPLVYPEISPGASVISERKLVKRDGTIIDVEINLKKFTDDRVLVVARDITERKGIEEQLKLSEQKYKLLFESNPMPLWIVDKEDMRVITANDAAAKLYGYTPEELLHMDIKKLRPVVHWEKLINRYQVDLIDATDFGVVEHIKKDGTEVLVNITAQDILFEGKWVRLSATADVTEKLKAEESLKKTEANLETILNTNDTAYALLDRELEILEYNNNAVVFVRNEFNIEPETGGKIFDHLPDDKRERFFEYISEVFKGNTISYEVVYSQNDNTDIWYYVKMFPISDKDNEILGLVLAISDITERKEAEQSLQSAYDQIKTNIKFIREMIWKQSHILRSPVANLKGLVTILGTDPSDKEVMEHIQHELERMDAVFVEMAADSSKEQMNY